MKYIVFILLLLTFYAGTVMAQNRVIKTEILSYHLNSSDTDTLVDIGCGYGHFDVMISFYYPELNFILEDIDSQSFKKMDSYFNRASVLTKNLKNRYRRILGNKDTIPLASLNYSQVLCRLALHEFTDQSKMLVELNRILIHGGKLIIVESYPEYKDEIDPYCKKRLLTSEEIKRYTEKVGFILESNTLLHVTRSGKLNIFIFKKI